MGDAEAMLFPTSAGRCICHNSVPHEALLYLFLTPAYNFLIRKLIVCILNAGAGMKRGECSMFELFLICHMIYIACKFALFTRVISQSHLRSTDQVAPYFEILD